MKPVTEQTAAAIRDLLKSLNVSRPFRYDKIAIAVGGNELNGNTRFIALEFCMDISDPQGYWRCQEDRAQYAATVRNDSANAPGEGMADGTAGRQSIREAATSTGLLADTPGRKESGSEGSTSQTGP